METEPLILRRRIQRTVATAGAVLLLVMFAGATYQGVATALERRRFLRPGGMVDAGGHQLHIYCLGEGSPAVILEAPAAGMSAAWGLVQPQVARVTRVCSYDRAGLGYSERSDDPYDPAATVRELRTLLHNANERAPFVVVGHGLGAAFARLFASRFGDDTPALILVDPPNGAEQRREPMLVGRFAGALPWLARAGVLRATDTLSRKAADLPQPSGGTLCAFLNRPDHLSRTADELSRWTDVTALAANASIGPQTAITHVEVVGKERVAFLTAESHAAPVVKAILEAVARARETDGTATGQGTSGTP